MRDAKGNYTWPTSSPCCILRNARLSLRAGLVTAEANIPQIAGRSGKCLRNIDDGFGAAPAHSRPQVLRLRARCPFDEDLIPERTSRHWPVSIGNRQRI